MPALSSTWGHCVGPFFLSLSTLYLMDVALRLRTGHGRMVGRSVFGGMWERDGRGGVALFFVFLVRKRKY